MSFRNYSFKNIDFIFGIVEVVEFDEGDDVIKIDPISDQFNSFVGAKGDVVRTQTVDNRALVTLRTLQTSNSNKKLMAIYNADREVGTGVFPLIVNDKEGGESHVGNNVWIKKQTPITRGSGKNAMEWLFEVDFLTSVFL